MANTPFQPGLFGDAEDPPSTVRPRRSRHLTDAPTPIADRAGLEAIAARLPPQLYFGTSSWSFPGWAGLVFSGRRSASALSRDGLREYAQHPLLRTVGVDRSFYAPVPGADLEHYANQLPAGFPCCLKAPATVTSVTAPGGGRLEPNRDFLSAERFYQEVLEPCARVFASHTGPFVLQFPPAPAAAAPEPTAFTEALDRFLGELPRQFQYAVEVRDRRYFNPGYFAVLRRHAASHVYNYWSAMPLPGPQADKLPADHADHIVIRLLMRPGTRYEQQRSTFAPFDRIQQPDELMREQVVRIVRRAATGSRRVFVLVNNKAEGSAPLTIRALAERLATG